LWFLQQLDPENIAYNSTYLIKYTGGIDPTSLEQALNELILRHAPLRTVYPNRGGRPIQVINPCESFSIPFVDISGLSEDEQRQTIRQYVSEHGDQPYDLQRGPLVRFALLHSGPKVDYFFFGTHHIGFDAWSRQIFFSELMQLYDSYRSGKQPTLPVLPIQYVDYALWQREWLSGDTLEAYLEHWKNILSGDLPILEIPTDRPRPALQSSRGTRYHFKLPRSLSSQMKDFCQRERLTPFQLLLSTFALLLTRYTGQEDIIIGCPFANRSRPELDGLVGLFVNTLPIRVNMGGNPSGRKFLDQVRTVMLEAYPWQAAPFEALVSDISPQRDLSRTPVFQVVINLRNVPKRATTIEGLKIENMLRENVPSAFDISLEFDVGEDGTLDASFQYNIDLFDENTILHMVGHYQNLLGELLNKSDRPIGELEMLTPSERQRIVINWNDTGKDFPEVCIQELFTGQAEKNPDALAVVCNGTSLTYSDLEKSANKLANYLRQGGMEAEARVGIYLPRSEKIVVSLMAILKAGGAYIPLDLTHPAERIAYTVKDSDPAAIITLSHLCNQLPEQIRKICLDTESDLIDNCTPGRPVPVTNNDSLAYVIYTSGSTGRPKGAMNVHKGIVNYLTYMNQEYQFNVTDRVIQLTSLSFDVSAFEIFGTLSYGGTMFLMDDAQMRDPDFIYAAVIDHQATYISCVPTMLRALCESALKGERKKHSLRLLLPAGEALREADVGLARRAFGDSVKLVNQYGPTECSIIHTNYLVPATLPNSLQIVPIGKPISNARAYVLDKFFHPVPVGAKGELFIGGIGVGRGYLNQPDLTAKWFFPDPFWPGGRMYRTGDIVQYRPDGTICFLGRSDNQVKIRGYRVELGEIEAVVSEFPGVKDAVVILWRQDESGTLAAYITVVDGNPEQIKGNLRSYLADRLPFYMLPATIMVLDEMPLNPNRKIDRHALPRPESGGGPEHYLAPRNDVETRLVLIWKEVLGMEQVGIRDNFFELGGHSLLAVRLFARIQEEFGQSLPLLLLFKDGTVEALASALSLQEQSPGQEVCIPIQVGGSRPPFFCISPTVIDVITYRDLSCALGPDQPFYALYSPRYADQKAAIQSDPVASFLEAVRQVQPSGPYYLGGYSRGGQLALLLALRLQALGERVELVVLLDSFAPHFPERLPWVTPGLLNFLLVLRRIQSYLWKFWILDGQGKRDLLLSGERPIHSRFREWTYKRQKELHRPLRRQSSQSMNDIEGERYRDYSGKVVLLRAKQKLPGVRWDPTLGWSSWFHSPIDVQVVPGEHESILFGPRIAKVASILNDYLGEAYQHQSGPRENT
jgi:amino acid adenylation domain-containing protein